MNRLINRIYYRIKPLIPRETQIQWRRLAIAMQKQKFREVWPILESAKQAPSFWKGWPEGKKFAVILTHDVEHQGGHDKCRQLLELHRKHGFVSLFNFVPERYTVDPQMRKFITDNGFEVGVHGLNHDGRLFSSHHLFRARSKKINRYLREWGAVGFRAPAMHHNLKWIHELDIEYDLSTFDTDPFEPQSDGVGTIFPFPVSGKTPQETYVEMPYTLSQDFTTFILMQEKSTDLWRKKARWIIENGGMILLNTHPDYMFFGDGEQGSEEFDVSLYEDFLLFLKENYAGQYWNPLPREAARYVRGMAESPPDASPGINTMLLPFIVN
nr:hypothetical protein [Calditrichia bacterium]